MGNRAGDGEMTGPNFRYATRAMLCEIVFNDEGAPLEHKIAAAEELKRRNRRKKRNTLQQRKIRRYTH